MRAIINLVLEPLELTTGVYSFSLTSVGILVHDSNNRTLLRLDNTTNSNNGKASKLMAINATNINSLGMLRLVDDSDIIASKASIGATINQRAKNGSMMSRNSVGDAVNITLEFGRSTKDSMDVTKNSWSGASI